MKVFLGKYTMLILGSTLALLFGVGCFVGTPGGEIKESDKQNLLLQSSIPIKSLPDKKRLGEAVVNMFTEGPDIKKTATDLCKAYGLYSEIFGMHPGEAAKTLESCTKAIAGKTDATLVFFLKSGLENNIGATLENPSVMELSPEELRIARNNMEDLISIYSIKLSNKSAQEKALEFAQKSQEFALKVKLKNVADADLLNDKLDIMLYFLAELYQPI